MAENQKYWTILVMASLPHSVKFPEQQAYDDEVDKLQITMVRLITIGLLRSWHGFQSLKSHIDYLFTNGAEIFNPLLHNDLLLDDEVCSQSLKFSWIVNTLYEVHSMIEQNIIAWDNYLDHFIRPSLDKGQVWTEADKDKLCGKIERCNEMRNKLRYMQNGFKDQRSRALALREGVFLASSILGARASTRLGENVQLLTFVSIFYLPLSFCTSLWSTTNEFSYKALACTMVSVSAATYLVVFNLRYIVGIIHGKYLRWKRTAINQMKQEYRQPWRRIADSLERSLSRAGRGESEPSEWWIVVYYVLKLLEKGGLRNAGRHQATVESRS
ncbi:predicted protein [Aspergillus terreus NIH2624]|uniref:Uncharacterized protein n=1 Tax=Aspergillus terreus (strain NIH 2624 / FGSC A1156) TaxID=341663 RepID=Q0CBP8_ASPTN|nr:uncharacterized protein ATEG_08886 [Aspergillus terreus NIH2624]EAU31018.1 predicted protein [Aspergillus terreus NIH2624]